MNPYWNKGTQPCLVTGTRTSFHVACKRGLTDLMRCWDITLRLHQAAPSVSACEWFKPVVHVTATLPVYFESVAGHQTLIEDRCGEGKRETNWGIKDEKEGPKEENSFVIKNYKRFLKLSIISKIRIIYWLLRVGRLKWYWFLLLINS